MHSHCPNVCFHPPASEQENSEVTFRVRRRARYCLPSAILTRLTSAFPSSIRTHCIKHHSSTTPAGSPFLTKRAVCGTAFGSGEFLSRSEVVPKCNVIKFPLPLPTIASFCLLMLVSLFDNNNYFFVCLLFVFNCALFLMRSRNWLFSCCQAL
jgi:hypothetical protein